MLNSEVIALKQTEAELTSLLTEAQATTLQVAELAAETEEESRKLREQVTGQ